MPSVHRFFPFPTRKRVHAALQVNTYVLATQPLFLVRMYMYDVLCVMCSTWDKQGQIAFDHVQLADKMYIVPSKSKLTQNSEK